ALLAYREFRLLLHRELNAEPDPETQALFRQIQEEARRRAQAPPPPLSSLPSSAQVRPLPPHLISEGTLTFLFTDVEGSTRLWAAHPAAMRDALARHDALLRHVIDAHMGVVFKTIGDQFCAAFASAPEALAAALAAQRALQAEAWEQTGPLRVRMALHTGA